MVHVSNSFPLPFLTFVKLLVLTNLGGCFAYYFSSVLWFRGVIRNSGFLSSLAFRFEQATSSEYAGSSI